MSEDENSSQFSYFAFSPRKICLRQNKRYMRTQSCQAGAHGNITVRM